MGEYADYYNDECDTHENQILDYKLGLMHDCDAYDLGIINELGGLICTEPKTTVCKYCKKSGLVWGTINGKYRLFDHFGKMHSCLEHDEL